MRHQDNILVAECVSSKVKCEARTRVCGGRSGVEGYPNYVHLYISEMLLHCGIIVRFPL